MRKNKWAVYGEYGGRFTNLKDAKACAREASMCEDTYPNPYSESVWEIESGICYIDYENGKCVRDGWTIKRPRTVK